MPREPPVDGAFEPDGDLCVPVSAKEGLCTNEFQSNLLSAKHDIASWMDSTSCVEHSSVVVNETCGCRQGEREVDQVRAVQENPDGHHDFGIEMIETLLRIKTAATVLSEQLASTEDEEHLHRACLSICDLFGDGIHNEYIQAILEAQVVPRVVRILEPVLFDLDRGEGVPGEHESRNSNGSASSRSVYALKSSVEQVQNIASRTRKERKADDPSLPRASRTSSRRRRRQGSSDASHETSLPRRSVSPALQSAALQVIGNIACGDDRQTQVIIDCPGALAILGRLLSSPESNIRKECCWIVSNITESAHQVQDVIRAGILPPLIALSHGDDVACCEDASWVLYNVTETRCPDHLNYLATNGGVGALCDLLMTTKELDVAWKGCSTVAAVALKALSNLLDALPHEMSPLIAREYGVERLDRLSFAHCFELTNGALQIRARALLETFYGMKKQRLANPAKRTQHENSDCKSDTGDPTPLGQWKRKSDDEAPWGSSVGMRAGEEHGTDSVCSRPMHQDDQNGIQFPDCIGETREDYRRGTREACAFCMGEEPACEPLSRDFLGKTHREETAALLARSIRMGHELCLAYIIDTRCTVADRDLICDSIIPEGGMTCLAPWAEPTTSSGRYHREWNANASNMCDQNDKNCCDDSTCSNDRCHQEWNACSSSSCEQNDRNCCNDSSCELQSGTTGIGDHPSWPPPCKPLLMLAVELGRARCLVLLLGKFRPHIDQIENHRQRITFLAAAAYKGHTDVVRVLLAYRKMIEMKDAIEPLTQIIDVCNFSCERFGEGLTILHLAAAGGHTEMCDILSRECAGDVNARDDKDQRPLSFAACYGWSTTCALLLDRGAELLASDCRGLTSLHLACMYGYDNVVRILLECARDQDERRARCEGNDDPDERILKQLIEARSKGNVTPLHYAVQGRCLECVDLLIKAGVEVMDPDPLCGSRNPLLLLAAESGSLEICKRLIEANAPIHCCANMKVTIGEGLDWVAGDGLNCHGFELIDVFAPLHLAASKGDVLLATLLLHRGADVNRRSTNGWTALDLAVLNGHEHMTRILISRGAYVDHGVKPLPAGMSGHFTTGKTLIQLAALTQKKDIVRMLVERLRRQTRSADPLCADKNRSLTVEGDEFSMCEKDVCDGVCSTCANHGYADGMEASSLDSSVLTSKSALNASKKQKDSDREAQKQKDMRRRETEAGEARERLLDAINTRSILKLQDAIAQGNKVILQLAAGYVKTGASKLMGPEILLSTEVERARRELASLQQEHQKLVADRERAALEMHQEAARRQLQEAVDHFCTNGDVRVFDKALKKASRAQLPKESDPTLHCIEHLRSCLARLQTSMRAVELSTKTHNVEQASRALASEIRAHADDCQGAMNDMIDAGAIRETCAPLTRARQVICAAMATATELDRICTEKERQHAEERTLADSTMENLDRMIIALRESHQKDTRQMSYSECEAQVEKVGQMIKEKLSIPELQSDVENRLGVVRRTLNKIVRNERRRLRQCVAQGNADAMNAAIAAAKRLDLRSLDQDIEAAQASCAYIEEQRLALSSWHELQKNKSAITSEAVHSVRESLEKLGLVEEAEKARVLGELLARENRTRQQLEFAVAEVKRIRKVDWSMAKMGTTLTGITLDNDDDERVPKEDAPALFVFGDQEAALTKRLRELRDRARRFQALASIVDDANTELEALEQCVASRIVALVDISSSSDDDGDDDDDDIDDNVYNDIDDQKETERESAMGTTSGSDTRFCKRDPASHLVALRLQETADQIRSIATLYEECFSGAGDHAGAVTENTRASLIARAHARADRLIRSCRRRCGPSRPLSRPSSESSERAGLAQTDMTSVVRQNDEIHDHCVSTDLYPQKAPPTLSKILKGDALAETKRSRHVKTASTTKTTVSGESPLIPSAETDDSTSGSTTGERISGEGKKRSPMARGKLTLSKGIPDNKTSIDSKRRDSNSSANAKRGGQRVAQSESGSMSVPSSPEKRTQSMPRKEDLSCLTERAASLNRQESMPTNHGCSHYYVWFKTNIVVCCKCGDVRISHNQNWLDRVKRRTQRRKERLAPEFVTVAEEAVHDRKQRQSGASDLPRSDRREATPERLGESGPVAPQPLSSRREAHRSLSGAEFESNVRAVSAPVSDALWSTSSASVVDPRSDAAAGLANYGSLGSHLISPPTSGTFSSHSGPAIEMDYRRCTSTGPLTRQRIDGPFGDSISSPGGSCVSDHGMCRANRVSASCNAPRGPVHLAPLYTNQTISESTLSPAQQQQQNVTAPLLGYPSQNPLVFSESPMELHADHLRGNFGVHGAPLASSGMMRAPNDGPPLPPPMHNPMGGMVGRAQTSTGATHDAFLFGAPSALAKSTSRLPSSNLNHTTSAADAFADDEFASENFGFDIDAIIDESTGPGNPPRPTLPNQRNSDRAAYSNF